MPKESCRLHKQRSRWTLFRVVLHADAKDAYPSLDRGLMLEAIYNDERFQHTWRSFELSFTEPSVVLVRNGGKVVHTSVSDDGVPKGHVL